MLKTKTYFHCRVLLQLAFKLDGECLSGEEELLIVLLDEEEGEGACLHYLLDTRPGALHPEDDFKCVWCRRSWQDLLVESVEKTSAFYNADYPCVHGGKGFVVPSTYLVCPHCSSSKDSHLVSLFTKVVAQLVNSNVLCVLPQDREARQFDGLNYPIFPGAL